MTSKSTALAWISAMTLTACGTVSTTEVLQAVQVTPSTPDGVEISGVNCLLRNDRGQWSLSAPGHVDVIPSDSPIYITCNKSGFPVVSLTVDKIQEGRVMGNLGSLGKLVIGSSNTARPAHMTQGKPTSQPVYPSSISVVMTLPLDTGSQTSSPASSNATANPSISTIDLDGVQKQCTEIGFTKGTENFGLCVLKLLK